MGLSPSVLQELLEPADSDRHGAVPRLDSKESLGKTLSVVYEVSSASSSSGPRLSLRLKGDRAEALGLSEALLISAESDAWSPKSNSLASYTQITSPKCVQSSFFKHTALTLY